MNNKGKPIIAKLSTVNSSIHSYRINIHPKINESDAGYPITIYETLESRNLPVQPGFLNIAKAGNDTWMTISANARITSENGLYRLAAKRNDAGDLINKYGNIVTDDKEAAKKFIYDKEAGSTYNIQIASLSVKNTGASGAPTKCTLINAKFFKESEAIHIRSALGDVKQLPEALRSAEYDKISDYKKRHGEWMNLFIQDGHDFFRTLGFEVRENVPSPKSPKGYNDDIPF
ncbi:hypothetical protein LMH73_015225 [Vibrio splendidus]|nr:hypothetical protein [Vibrio splendidus]MCC4882870.1 hypothetical protein [Vibrio splendidus]